MIRSKEKHRYLPRIDTHVMGHLYTDCLIIGGGVAGLRAAIEIAPTSRVLLLVKDTVDDSNTFRAQGGIAAVIRDDDTIQSHIDDTLGTGCGLCDEDIVKMVVQQAPDHIRQLCNWDTPFDRNDDDIIDAGREGGHSHNRVIHALGDATGKAIARSLLSRVRMFSNIKIFEKCFCIDIITSEDGVCRGVVCHHPKYGMKCIWAKKVILATGGTGRLWRETTNPPCATADGLAMAYRAGAKLCDLELMQFHPTTLYIAGADRTLVTEALRGEGGLLVDANGDRFMDGYHKMAELAPRDVVSRAIHDIMAKRNLTNVFLDVRHLGAKWLSERFPTISALCGSFDINVDTDLIPVRPSAHYMIGGVKTDINGRTSIDGLYCCGEAAASGLHGANRLASNSLLEGLVFGKICGENIAIELAESNTPAELYHMEYSIEESKLSQLDVHDVKNSLRAIMWRNVGLIRTEDTLAETIVLIDFWQQYVMDKVFDEPVNWECQNMLTISKLITEGAISRRESRGVHYRQDFKQRDDDNFKYHIEL